MQEQMKEETIELKVIMQLIRQFKYRFIAIICATTLVAVILSLVLPKQYESTMMVRAKSPKQAGAAASLASFLGGANSASPVQAYMELLKSRSVLEPVIAKLDVPDKEKIDSKIFAKNYLKINNPKGTDLIEITAKGRTREEAMQVASEVTISFRQLLTTLNQSEQSMMLRFLGNRIDVAKKELEEAEKKFEAFRQQEKIFVPEEQASALMSKAIGFDKKLAELQVQNEVNKIRLNGIKEELDKQKVAIKKDYVADNPTILQFRKATIEKELLLAGLRQRYTDKHPSIISLQAEIEEINKKMHEEVDKDVKADIVSLTPIHGELLKQKVSTEMELQLGLEMLDVINRAQKDSEKQVGQLSDKGMTYTSLARQHLLAQEVYTTLKKNYEQTRIQETMESMDIQVVDSADLPLKPSFPDKSLFVMIGSFSGFVLSLVYLVMMYIRSGSKL